MNTWLNEFLFRVHPLVILVILISVTGASTLCCLAGFVGPLVGWR